MDKIKMKDLINNIKISSLTEAENILKGGYDDIDFFEKARVKRVPGERHPLHPHWIWTEYAPGKFDWKSEKGKHHKNKVASVAPSATTPAPQSKSNEAAPAPAKSKEKKQPTNKSGEFKQKLLEAYKFRSPSDSDFKVEDFITKIAKKGGQYYINFDYHKMSPRQQKEFDVVAKKMENAGWRFEENGGMGKIIGETDKIKTSDDKKDSDIKSSKDNNVSSAQKSTSSSSKNDSENHEFKSSTFTKYDVFRGEGLKQLQKYFDKHDYGEVLRVEPLRLRNIKVGANGDKEKCYLFKVTSRIIDTDNSGKKQSRRTWYNLLLTSDGSALEYDTDKNYYTKVKDVIPEFKKIFKQESNEATSVKPKETTTTSKSKGVGAALELAGKESGIDFTLLSKPYRLKGTYGGYKIEVFNAGKGKYGVTRWDEIGNSNQIYLTTLKNLKQHIDVKRGRSKHKSYVGEDGETHTYTIRGGYKRTKELQNEVIDDWI